MKIEVPELEGVNIRYIRTGDKYLYLASDVASAFGYGYAENMLAVLGIEGWSVKAYVGSGEVCAGVFITQDVMLSAARNMHSDEIQKMKPPAIGCLDDPIAEVLLESGVMVNYYLTYFVHKHYEKISKENKPKATED
ncbi:hypothetical protein [Devriesea agamarum]|uniref:hypothetical protein n=1 Tax=Devriesea agamarum TaxID=472569 RepID=UPI00071C8725|nr:hypothetical protein [Devriesea agamarum]